MGVELKKRALKTYFLNQLLITSDGILHQYNIFCQSYNSFGHFSWAFAVLLFLFVLCSLVRSEQDPVGKGNITHCCAINQDLAIFQSISGSCWMFWPPSIKYDQTTCSTAVLMRQISSVSVKL